MLKKIKLSLVSILENATNQFDSIQAGTEAFGFPPNYDNNGWSFPNFFAVGIQLMVIAMQQLPHPPYVIHFFDTYTNKHGQIHLPEDQSYKFYTKEEVANIMNNPGPYLQNIYKFCGRDPRGNVIKQPQQTSIRR